MSSLDGFLPDADLTGRRGIHRTTPSKNPLGLRAGIQEIAGDPIGLSDATDQDSTGRLVQITVIGDYALIYWIDDADRHIKILDIHSADR